MLTDLPASGLIPVLLIGLVGLLLWLAGHRVLRAGIAGLGFVVGLSVGWIVVDVLGRPVEPWFGGCLSGVMFALVGAFASKLIVTAAMAAVLALASPLITLSLAEIGGLPLGGSAVRSNDEGNSRGSDSHFNLESGNDGDESSSSESKDDRQAEHALDILMTDQQAKLDEVKSKLDALRANLPEIDADTQEHIDRVRLVASDVAGSVWAKWSEADQRLRLTLLVSAVVGGLLGLLFGTFSPRFSGSVVTALAGSMIVLVCAWIVLMRADAPQGAWMPASPLGWSICWLCAAIIGLSIQWTFRQRPADRAA